MKERNIDTGYDKTEYNNFDPDKVTFKIKALLPVVLFKKLFHLFIYSFLTNKM